MPGLKGSPRTPLWLSPLLAIPLELQKDVTVVDLPLPAEAEYREALDCLIATLRQWAETNCRQATEAQADEPETQDDTLAGRRARMVDL